MKIVRVLFSVDGTNQFIHQMAYDAEKNDQENCDLAMQYMLGAAKEKAVVPAFRVVKMADGETVQRPVIINLYNVAVIDIDQVAIYTAQQPKDVSTENDAAN